MGEVHYFGCNYLYSNKFFKKSLYIWRDLENKQQETWTLSWFMITEIKLGNNNQDNNLKVILELISNNEISEVDIPIVNWNLYQIFNELNDTNKAMGYLDVAYNELIRQANKIKQLEDRVSFLSKVRDNRIIVQKWKRINKRDNTNPN